jgi:hypothetical protein
MASSRQKKSEIKLGFKAKFTQIEVMQNQKNRIVDGLPLDSPMDSPVDFYGFTY